MWMVESGHRKACRGTSRRHALACGSSKREGNGWGGDGSDGMLWFLPF